MKSREVIKRLKKNGWVLTHIRGSHHQFKHPKKDLPKGTLRSIFRQAGWAWPPR